MSCDNEATRGFGPLLPGHLKVDFGDSSALEKIFKGLVYIMLLVISIETVLCYICSVLNYRHRNHLGSISAIVKY